MKRYTLRCGDYDPEIDLDLTDIEYRGPHGKFTACENVAEELQGEMIDRLNADPDEIRQAERRAFRAALQSRYFDSDWPDTEFAEWFDKGGMFEIEGWEEDE